MEVALSVDSLESFLGPFRDALRKYNFDSFEEFQNIELITRDSKLNTAQIKLKLLQQSKEFRKHITGLENSFGELAQLIDENGYSSSLDSEYDLIHSLSIHWHLLEVFALNPATFIVHDIIEWLQNSYTSKVLRTDAKIFFGKETHPQNITNEEAVKASFPSGYWDSVYQLVLQGHLTNAVELLQSHSEIKSILTYRHPKQNMNTSSFLSPLKQSLQSQDCTQSEQLQGLLHTLLAHPYLTPHTRSPTDNFLDTSMDWLTHEYEYIQGLEERMDGWKASMIALYRHPQSIIYTLPELDVLFRICLADTNMIAHIAQGDWAYQTLAQLFYQYTPKLARPHFAQLLQDNLAYSSQYRLSQGLEDLTKSSLTQNVDLLKHSLQQQVGLFVSVFYSAALSLPASSPFLTSSLHHIAGYAAQREFTMTLLLSLVHLMRCLVVSSACEGGLPAGNYSELITQLPHSHHETHFLEEVVLESMQAFVSLSHYPVEMLIKYLALCPIQGKAYLRMYLTRYAVTSDAQAVQFAAILDDLHCPEEAKEVRISRAQYWLTKVPYKQVLQESVSANRKAFGCFKAPAAQPLQKAITFFQYAHEYAHISKLLECVFYRLQHAVVQCTSQFPGLTIWPGILVPNVLGNNKVSSEKLTQILALFHLPNANTVSIPSQPMLLSTNQLFALVMKEEEVQEQVEILSYALMEANQVIEGIDLPVLMDDLDDDKVCNFLRIVLPKQYDALKCYLEAITLRLQALAPTPADTTKTVYSPLTISRKLRQAADHVIKLLLPNLETQEAPIVSNRYWLHLLDLCLCFHAMIGDYESRLTLDVTFLAQYIDTTAVENGGEIVPEKFSLGVYSKEMVYALHDLFTSLEQSNQAEWIFGITQTTPQLRKAMKTKLLGMLMSSLATEKIVFGKAKQQQQQQQQDGIKRNGWQLIDAEAKQREEERERQRRISAFGYDPLIKPKEGSLSSGGLILPHLSSFI